MVEIYWNPSILATLCRSGAGFCPWNVASVSPGTAFSGNGWVYGKQLGLKVQVYQDFCLVDHFEQACGSRVQVVMMVPSSCKTMQQYVLGWLWGKHYVLNLSWSSNDPHLKEIQTNFHTTSLSRNCVQRKDLRIARSEDKLLAAVGQTCHIVNYCCYPYISIPHYQYQ